MTKEEQKQYSREVYYWRKEHGMCVYCGHEPAEPGTVSCPECKNKQRQRSLKCYYDMPEEKKLEKAELSKALYEDRKKKGLCVICGKPCMRGRVGSASRKRKSLYCKEHNDMVKGYRQKYKKRKLLKEQEVKND